MTASVNSLRLPFSNSGRGGVVIHTFQARSGHVAGKGTGEQSGRIASRSGGVSEALTSTSEGAVIDLRPAAAYIVPVGRKEAAPTASGVGMVQTMKSKQYEFEK